MFAAFTTGNVPAQEPEKGEDLEFYVALYGWMPNIYGESATGTYFEIDLDDILDSLQFMVMAVSWIAMI